MRAAQRFLFSFFVKNDADALVIILFYTAGMRRCQNIYPFFLKNIFKFFGHIFIFAFEKVIGLLNHGYFTSEASEHLAKLKGDITPAKDDKMFGNFFQIKNTCRIKII